MGREFRLSEVVFDRCSVARCDGSSGHCWRFLLTHSGTAVQGHTLLALPGHTVANHGKGWVNSSGFSLANDPVPERNEVYNIDSLIILCGRCHCEKR
jgi:hypothetical protein